MGYIIAHQELFAFSIADSCSPNHCFGILSWQATFVKKELASPESSREKKPFKPFEKRIIMRTID